MTDLFGNPINVKNTLREQFGEVPVSVFNTNTKHWIQRKRKWIQLGIESEIGRGENLLNFSKLCNQVQGGKESHKSVSVFDPVLCELMYNWFCPQGGNVLDCFAGGSVRGIVANFLGFKYTGVELRSEQVESNINQALNILPINNQPNYYCGDSLKEIPLLTSEYDLLFTCPPYGDLEVYSKLPEDLSNMDYSDFLINYEKIIHQSCEKIKKGGYAILVVGEIRCNKGYYRDFVGSTKNILSLAGMKFYNEIILINNIGSAAIRIPKIFKATKKITKIHQNVLIFKKD